MSYRVLAPLVLVRVPGVGDDYRVDYHYEGSIVPRLTDEQRERFLDEGFVEELDASEEPAHLTDDRPKKTASQEAWAAYAVSAHGVSQEEAAALSRQELIELYGG